VGAHQMDGFVDSHMTAGLVGSERVRRHPHLRP